MTDPVIVSSVTGEVRIEATANKGDNTACFKTYYRNNLLSELNHNNEPISKLSIQGICAYYVIKKEELRKFLHTKMPPSDATRILGELVKDMAVDI